MRHPKHIRQERTQTFKEDTFFLTIMSCASLSLIPAMQIVITILSTSAGAN